MTHKSKKQPLRQKKRIPKKITPTYLYNAGLYYLQRFPASSSHFRTVMMRKVNRSCHVHNDQSKDECARMVNDLIIKFQDLGLLNDELYTQGMINSLRRAGKSRKAIITKLRAKGVPSNLINDHLQQYEDQRLDQSQSTEIDAAMVFARKKKIGPFRDQSKKIDEHTAYQKALAQMARAGFSYGTCRYVLGVLE